MSSTNNVSNKRARRWTQFSLRTLLLVSTAIAIWLGFVAYQARQQREVVKLVEALGGQVVYERAYSIISEQPILQWFCESIGREYFCSVKGIDVASAELADEHIEQFGTFRKLRSLQINSPNVTDAGIEKLHNCGCLEELEIQFAAITDRGIEHITRFERLKRLVLNNVEITDAGVEKLRAMQRLHVLSIGNFSPTRTRSDVDFRSEDLSAKITNEGLLSLAAIPSLKEVWLLRSRISDDGARKLAAERPDIMLHVTSAQYPFPDEYWKRIEPPLREELSYPSRDSLAPKWEPARVAN
jgi:hypothetical protein